MIGISTRTYNDSGDIVIHESIDSDMEKYPKRAARVSTLDGGAVIVDGGFSHGDRTIKIKASLTRTEAAKLLAIHQTETLIYISMQDGFFSGTIEDLDLNGGEIEMSILIEEKLSD